MKVCSKCKIEKDIDQYNKKRGNKDGLSYYCKDCASINNKLYKDKNRDIYREKSKEYYWNNKEYFKENAKEYYKENKDKFFITNKEYYTNNKEYFINKAKEYKVNNQEKLNQYNKEYIKLYYSKDENKLKRSEYRKNKKDIDPVYKLVTIIRSVINYSIKNKNYYKNNKTIEILGCSYEDFRIYIESKFECWMTWENHGIYNGELNYGWDIDHIIPLSSVETEEDIIRLNHYTNLQPLCSYTNRYIKRNRLDYK